MRETANRLIVTSAEFARQFGSLRQARQEVVTITHHGRETHVLLTRDRYEQLRCGGPEGGSGQLSGLPMLSELSSWIQQGLIVLLPDATVAMANSVAHAMAALADGELIGRELFDAIPALRDSPAEGYIRRAMAGLERSVAELPSVVRSGTWIRLELFPTARCTTLLFCDITDDVERNRLADTKLALVEAIGAHGGIGYMRLGLRGEIQRVEQSFCKMLKISGERLVSVKVWDLVPIHRRAQFREITEAALSNRGGQDFDTEFLVNDGSIISVHCSITELRGIYGSEGAVLISTKN